MPEAVLDRVMKESREGGYAAFKEDSVVIRMTSLGGTRGRLSRRLRSGRIRFIRTWTAGGGTGGFRADKKGGGI